MVAFTATQIPGIDRRRYPPELAGPLYPEGIPIVPESELDDLIREQAVDEVIFAYSDVSHEFVMHQASRVLAAGADFCSAGPGQHRHPVLGAGHLGAGRAHRRGQEPGVAVRRRPAHGAGRAARRSSATPCPTATWSRSGCSASPALEDLDRYEATVEEREDYEPHIRRGLVVWAGVDYQAIVAEAEKEASLIIWDGGNNDFSFLRSDLEIVIVDPFRPGHELAYHPGEVNLRRADVVVINKVNSAPPANVEQVEANVREVNPRAVIVWADSVITRHRQRADRGQAGPGGGGRSDAHARRHGHRGRRGGGPAVRGGGDHRSAAVRPGRAGRDLRRLSRTWGRSCRPWATTRSNCATSRPPSTPCRPTWW